VEDGPHCIPACSLTRLYDSSVVMTSSVPGYARYVVNLSSSLEMFESGGKEVGGGTP